MFCKKYHQLCGFVRIFYFNLGLEVRLIACLWGIFGAYGSIPFVLKKFFLLCVCLFSLTSNRVLILHE